VSKQSTVVSFTVLCVNFFVYKIYCSHIFLGTDDFKDSVRHVRQKLRRVAKARLVFVDETSMKTDVDPTHTLALPGDSGDVEVERPNSFSARVDFIGAITANEVFPPSIITPADRARLGTRGVTQDIFNAINESLQQSFTLVLDRSRAHSLAGIGQALDNAGCDKVEHIVVLPKETAKKVSPLDNALWNDWKKMVQHSVKNKRVDVALLSRQMRLNWQRLSHANLQAHYHHCRLYAGDGLDDDL
jgi:hypothetical protein